MGFTTRDGKGVSLGPAGEPRDGKGASFGPAGEPRIGKGVSFGPAGTPRDGKGYLLAPAGEPRHDSEHCLVMGIMARRAVPLHPATLRPIQTSQNIADIMEFSDKSCRNCGSTELYSQEVHTRGVYGPDLLPVGLFTMPKFHIRVCGGCGLVEWFVPPEHLGKVKEKFPLET